MDDLAEIAISRRAIQDLARSYRVFIDGAESGRLWAFQTGRYRVAPGEHTIRLAIVRTGTASSDDVQVDVPPGGTRRMRTCGRGIKSLLTMPLAQRDALRQLGSGRPLESRWYKRPWIILRLEDG